MNDTLNNNDLDDLEFALFKKQLDEFKEDVRQCKLKSNYAEESAENSFELIERIYKVIELMAEMLEETLSDELKDKFEEKWDKIEKELDTNG